MKDYTEKIKEMESKGWFRVSETNTHIFFAQRSPDGSFIRIAVKYK